MATLTEGSQERVSAPNPASVPALPVFDIIPLERGSSTSGSHRRMVDLAEGCLVTKTVHYTNQLAHMVNAVRISDDRAQEVVSILSMQWMPIGSKLFIAGRPDCPLGNNSV
jgi:hypothetical protein